MNTAIQRLCGCAALSAALTGACGGAAVPRGATTPAEASLAAAAAVGAERHPGAKLHLKLARDQIATAQKLLVDEDVEEALLVLERAEADAKLAESLARQETLKVEAQRAEQKVEELRQARSGTSENKEGGR